MNIKSLIFLLVLVSPSITSADMILNKSIIYFEPGQPNREDLEIQNAGADPLYIQVTPKVVHKPGSNDQSREVFDNPKQAGLLVSPNKQNQTITKAVTDIAKAYNRKTVAEYIENKEIADIVRDIGVNYGQGYYFSKPFPISQLSASKE